MKVGDFIQQQSDCAYDIPVVDVNSTLNYLLMCKGPALLSPFIFSHEPIPVPVPNQDSSGLIMCSKCHLVWLEPVMTTRSILDIIQDRSEPSQHQTLAEWQQLPTIHAFHTIKGKRVSIMVKLARAYPVFPARPSRLYYADCLKFEDPHYIGLLGIEP